MVKLQVPSKLSGSKSPYAVSYFSLHWMFITDDDKEKSLLSGNERVAMMLIECVSHPDPEIKKASSSG